jgi:hypothetical protein
MPAPAQSTPYPGQCFPGRFFSTALSRNTALDRWSLEEPSRMARLFSSACRVNPGLVIFSPSQAVDLQCFSWQTSGMLLSDLSKTVPGHLFEGNVPGVPQVRAAIFSTSRDPLQAILSDHKPKMSFSISAPMEFASPPPPNDPAEIFVDEMSGMVLGPNRTPLVLGLPKNPRGKTTSRLRATDHPGFDPKAVIQIKNHIGRGSAPTLVRPDSAFSLPALTESWLYMLARTCPRRSLHIKARLELRSGNSWGFLETIGRPIPPKAENFFQQARSAEREKLCAALAVLSPSSGSPALRSLLSRTAPRRPFHRHGRATENFRSGPSKT